MTHCEVANLKKLLRQLNLYINYGYVRYALRTIPEDKDLKIIDEKISKVYAVTYCRTTRARRKKAGKANVIYLRLNRSFILLASEGEEHEACNKISSTNFLDRSLYFSGYSIGTKNQNVRGRGVLPRAWIEIAEERYSSIRKQLQGLALHNHQKVTDYFCRISPFYFAGINQQKWKLLLETNRTRKRAGLPQIKWSDIKKWRSSK